MPKWSVNSFQSGKWKFNGPIYREVIWIVTRCKNHHCAPEKLPIISGSLSKIQLLFHKHFNQNRNVRLGSGTFDFKKLVKFFFYFGSSLDMTSVNFKAKKTKHKIGLALSFPCKSFRHSICICQVQTISKNIGANSKFSHKKFIVLKAHGAQSTYTSHTPWNRHYSNLIYACDLHIDI